MRWPMVIAAFALVLHAPAHAQETPQTLLTRIGQSVADRLDANRAGKVDVNDSREFIERSVLPHVDFERMTALAAGRHWRNAAPAQKQQLVSEFRALLIRTYSGALLRAKQFKFEFKSIRVEPDGSEAEIKTVLAQPPAEPLQLDYRLEKTPQGWKIYDINVMGAWLVESYKNSFANEIGRSGIDGLITALAGKNKRNGESTP